MDSLLVNPKRAACCRVLQLTDMHLFADKNSELLGVATFDSFAAVVEQLQQQIAEYDLLLATGDLVQDHSFLGYQHFVEVISRLDLPCCWIAGNHDNKSVMQNVLRHRAALSESKIILLKEKWLIILLDSAVEGKAYGELSPQQLEFLATTLARYPERQALVVLHHHVTPVGSAWLDQHILKNSAALYAVLSQFPQASTLLCGHIHQSLQKRWYDKQLLSAPSTCVQFKPECAEFTLDTLPPGWRDLTLFDDGSLISKVSFLANSQFTPNVQLKGY